MPIEKVNGFIHNQAKTEKDKHEANISALNIIDSIVQAAIYSNDIETIKGVLKSKTLVNKFGIEKLVTNICCTAIETRNNDMLNCVFDVIPDNTLKNCSDTDFKKYTRFINKRKKRMFILLT